MTRKWTTAIVVAIPLLVIYLWPTLARSADRTDVVVIGDGAVVVGADELGRQLRLRGLRVELVTDVDPCAAETMRRAADGARAIVVSFTGATISSCREAAEAAVAALADPIVVAQDDSGLRSTVDARLLVPATPGARIGCEWWEPPPPASAIANCEPDGLITIRDESGELTKAGRDRFARVVAGAVP
jgi:hypothetical protein